MTHSTLRTLAEETARKALKATRPDLDHSYAHTLRHLLADLIEAALKEAQPQFLYQATILDDEKSFLASGGHYRDYCRIAKILDRDFKTGEQVNLYIEKVKP